MDPISIGTAAVAILAPYLTSLAAKVGESVTENLAKKAGSGAGGAVETLYQTIRQKFTADRDTNAERSLKSLETEPDSKVSQTAVAAVLDEKAQADPAFAKELADLVQQARQDPKVAKFLTNVYGNAQVNKLVNIGQAGDVKF
jgi:hypothetical protein